MARGYSGSIGGECGKCGEFYGVESRRFDFGPDGLLFKARDDWEEEEEDRIASFDDEEDQPELHMFCPDCRVWTVWVFDTQEYADTGGEGWPDPERVYWVSEEYWANNDEEYHRVAIYPEPAK
jgi:hypothetical protein